MKKIFALLFGMLVIASTASAHGLATSFTQVSGKYLMEFEYNTPGRVIAGQYENYNFDILDADTKNFVNFSRAFARISKVGGDVVTVADLFPTETLGAGMPSARLGTVFAESGDYNLDLVFYSENGSELASSSFGFTVDPGKLQNPMQGGQNIALEAILVCGGIILGFALSRLRHAK